MIADKLEAARARMKAFVERQTGAELEEACVIRETIVLGGRPAECEKVRAYMEGVGVEGVEVDALDPEDPELTFVRMPIAALELTLARLTVKV